MDMKNLSAAAREEWARLTRERMVAAGVDTSGWWRPDEDERLLREYPVHALFGTTDLLAADMGRTKGALRDRAKKIGATNADVRKVGRWGRFVGLRARALFGVDLVAGVRAMTAGSLEAQEAVKAEARAQAAAEREKAMAARAEGRAAQAQDRSEDPRIQAARERNGLSDGWALPEGWGFDEDGGLVDADGFGREGMVEV